MTTFNNVFTPFYVKCILEKYDFILKVLCCFVSAYRPISVEKQPAKGLILH